METFCAISNKKKSLFLGLLSDTQGQAGFLWAPSSLQALLCIWNTDIFKCNPRYSHLFIPVKIQSIIRASILDGILRFFWQTHWISLSKHFHQLSPHKCVVRLLTAWLSSLTTYLVNPCQASQPPTFKGDHLQTEVKSNMETFSLSFFSCL